MLTGAQVREAQERAVGVLMEAGIVLSDMELERIEVSDFGLSDLERTGLEIVVYINTARVCAKEIVLFPGQTCPEHLHPPVGANWPGKEETFRCRRGTVFLYVAGVPTARPACRPPRPQYYTVWHEVELHPGDQYTVSPGEKHWFQAPEGAVVSEFSSESRDELDIFSDPNVRRITEVAG